MYNPIKALDELVIGVAVVAAGTAVWYGAAALGDHIQSAKEAWYATKTIERSTPCGKTPLYPFSTTCPQGAWQGSIEEKRETKTNQLLETRVFALCEDQGCDEGYGIGPQLVVGRHADGTLSYLIRQAPRQQRCIAGTPSDKELLKVFRPCSENEIVDNMRIAADIDARAR